MQLLRSLLYTGLLFIWVAIYSCLVFLAGVLPFAVREWLVLKWVDSTMWLTRVVVGLDYVVEGEALPDQPVVAYMKHSSVWETLAQMHFLGRLPSIVLKHELMFVPLLGWALAVLRPIAINRRARHSAVQQVIRKGRERLRQGQWVAIFPEGTRMPPGTTRRYGLSGALLAREAGCPVLPIAHNAEDFWPRRSLYKSPGTIRVVIGPPIATAGRTPQDINAEAQRWIESTMRRIGASYAVAGDVEPA